VESQASGQISAVSRNVHEGIRLYSRERPAGEELLQGTTQTHKGRTHSTKDKGIKCRGSCEERAIPNDAVRELAKSVGEEVRS